MTWQVSLLVVSCALIGLLALGEWIVFALGIAGMFFLLISGGTPALGPMGSIVWESSSNYTLTSIPLFILMGELILQSRIGERFYIGMAMIFRRVPGGLLHTNIISCAIFAALTGVSVATAATIGTVAIPELTKQGYDRRMVFGTLAAGGTLGILIPPSIPFILYGVLAQQSVAKLFAAGILPGIMMVVLFVIYIGIRVLLNPALAGERSKGAQGQFSIYQVCTSVLPVVGLIALVVGGIYLGIMTPTEAAAVGAVLAMCLYIWYAGFNLETMKSVLIGTVRTSCMVLFIAVGAQIFSFSMVYTDLNQIMTTWVVSHGTTPETIFILIIAIYIVLGCFLDPISIIVLSMGVLYPIIVQFQFDPIWFGVILVIMVELGLITPPVGLNLFVIHGISGKRPMREIISGAFPYCFILLFGVVLLWYFPGIATFLPNSMR